MAGKLFQAPLPTSKAIPSIPKITKVINAQKLAPALQSTTKSIRLFEPPSGFRYALKYTNNVAEDSYSLFSDDMDVEEDEKEPSKHKTVDLIKPDFCHAIKGINRGIFGVQSARKSEIEGLVELLESQNPTPDPALHLEKAKAISVDKFGIRGLSLLYGQLTIEATFKIASKSRVDICYDKSTTTPYQLRNVLRKKYDLLLSIFNPEECSLFLDLPVMIGRDDKGNTFVLERSEKRTIK